MVWNILTNPEKKSRRQQIIQKWDEMFEEALAEFHIQAIKLREPEDEKVLRQRAFSSLLENLGIEVDLREIKGLPRTLQLTSTASASSRTCSRAVFLLELLDDPLDLLPGHLFGQGCFVHIPPPLDRSMPQATDSFSFDLHPQSLWKPGGKIESRVRNSLVSGPPSKTHNLLFYCG